MDGIILFLQTIFYLNYLYRLKSKEKCQIVLKLLLNNH